MYAIIETGNKQYKVAEGDVISVQKLGVEAGSEYVFDKVLKLQLLLYAKEKAKRLSFTNTNLKKVSIKRTVTDSHLQSFRSAKLLFNS